MNKTNVCDCEFLVLEEDRTGLRNNIELDVSRPGTPTDNPFIEAFNGRLRHECLNKRWFLSLEDARKKVEAWRKHYDGEHPHGALKHLAPDKFALALGAAG